MTDGKLLGTVSLGLALLLTLAAVTRLQAEERHRRDSDRDAFLRAYESQRLGRRPDLSQPFDSPFRVGPQNRSMTPSGSGSVVVPNR